MSTFALLYLDLKKAYKTACGHGGWREVGKQFGISGGMAFRIAQQRYEPKSPKIRTRLGLPSLVPVTPCIRCGEVHLHKRCTKFVKPKRDLFAMSADELRWRIENRDEVEK